MCKLWSSPCCIIWRVPQKESSYSSTDNGAIPGKSAKTTRTAADPDVIFTSTNQKQQEQQIQRSDTTSKKSFASVVKGNQKSQEKSSSDPDASQQQMSPKSQPNRKSQGKLLGGSTIQDISSMLIPMMLAAIQALLCANPSSKDIPEVQAVLAFEPLVTTSPTAQRRGSSDYQTKYLARVYRFPFMAISESRVDEQWAYEQHYDAVTAWIHFSAVPLSSAMGDTSKVSYQPYESEESAWPRDTHVFTVIPLLNEGFGSTTTSSTTAYMKNWRNPGALSGRVNSTTMQFTNPFCFVVQVERKAVALEDVEEEIQRLRQSILTAKTINYVLSKQSLKTCSGETTFYSIGYLMRSQSPGLSQRKS
ncbi:hypothetical protein HPB52_021673 [Rhipicephalus sanguineus]|uniref:Uncharacterized protein n=1 Tax=Rhipicephalus sanguineus TaxID=34632 RepID=A0A9D4T265_RHISA|nr:hypothetical protein HPB52_021673 [Rhipicephalus sanguineus]